MKKKTAIIIISYLSAAVVCLAVFAGVHYDAEQRYRLYASNNLDHAFQELAESVSQIDAGLQKSIYAASPSVAGAIGAQIYGEAMTARMSLGVLPFDDERLVQTAGFINRVGDYALYYARAAADGALPTDEERETLRSLARTARALSQGISDARQGLADGSVLMDGMEDSAAGETVSAALGNAEGEFPELPTLIYDGPFSDHISDMSSQMLAGAEEIDVDAGRRAAAMFLGIQEGRVCPAGETEGDVPSYRYTVPVDGGDYTVLVTKRGGYISGALSSRAVGERQLDAEEALAAAGRVLSRQGYADMKQTYYVIDGGAMTVNYAWVQDGAVCYSDHIKVCVAMDTGSLLSFDAAEYLKAHKARELPAVEVGEQQAAERVTGGLEIGSHSLALIPTGGKYEKLCHEFVCADGDGRRYIVYVNAVSGRQEQILILLEDENGALTI